MRRSMEMWARMWAQFGGIEAGVRQVWGIESGVRHVWARMWGMWDMVLPHTMPHIMPQIAHTMSYIRTRTMPHIIQQSPTSLGHGVGMPHIRRYSSAFNRSVKLRNHFNSPRPPFFQPLKVQPSPFSQPLKSHSPLFSIPRNTISPFSHPLETHPPLFSTL